MPVTKAQKAARDKYDAEHYEYATLKLQKGRKAEVKAAADARSESFNKFVEQAIDERMARLGRPEPLFTPPPGEWCEGCKKLGSRQYTPAGAEPEPERPWCFAYLCELEGTGDNARKCDKCAEKSRGA